MTTLRPSSVCALKRHTKPSTRTVQLTKLHDGRRLNSCSSLSLTPRSDNYGTPNIFTLRFPQRFYWPISEQGAPAGTPSTSCHFIMKCRATTSRSRASPSTLTLSRTHNDKPAGQGEKLPTRPYSSSPARRCSQVINFHA